MTHDFSDLTPPSMLVGKWLTQVADLHLLTPANLDYLATQGARWGAEQAAERLANQWPTPITDRPPKLEDSDPDGKVQSMDTYGRWHLTYWFDVFMAGSPWRHTPRWQPPAPPTLTPQQQHALAALDNLLQHCTDNTGEAVIRRAILGESHQ